MTSGKKKGNSPINDSDSILKVSCCLLGTLCRLMELLSCGKSISTDCASPPLGDWGGERANTYVSWLALLFCEYWVTGVKGITPHISWFPTWSEAVPCPAEFCLWTFAFILAKIFAGVSVHLFSIESALSWGGLMLLISQGISGLFSSAFCAVEFITNTSRIELFLPDPVVQLWAALGMILTGVIMSPGVGASGAMK